MGKRKDSKKAIQRVEPSDPKTSSPGATSPWLVIPVWLTLLITSSGAIISIRTYFDAKQEKRIDVTPTVDLLPQAGSDGKWVFPVDNAWEMTLRNVGGVAVDSTRVEAHYYL